MNRKKMQLLIKYRKEKLKLTMKNLINLSYLDYKTDEFYLIESPSNLS